MYCTTCELEIKGDDKDTCPVCGAPLTDSHADDSALINQSQQEQPASEEIFKDPTIPDVPDLETTPAGIAEEEAFVLKDYEPDFSSTDGSSSPSDASEDSQLFEKPDVQQEVDAQPLMTESVQGSSGSMDDVLDSIRESISTSESPVEEEPDAGGESVSLDEDFAFFDSLDKDSSAETPSEKTTDESAQISWGYDEAAAAVAMPDAPERKRSPVLKIVLIVALIAVGAYYVFALRSGDESSLDKGVADSDTSEEIYEAAASETQSEPTAAETSVAADPSLEVAEAFVSAEPVAADETNPAEPSAEAGPDAQVAPKAVDAVASVEGTKPAEPSAAVVPEVQVAPGAVDAVASVEETKLAEPSALVVPEAQVAPEAVDAGGSVGSVEETKLAEPSAVVVPEAQVALEAVGAVVPVKPAPVTAPFFTVHVGSYRKRASATSEVVRIKAKGYDAFIERVDLGKKGVWYRVKVGRFKIRAEAEQLQEKIKKIPVTDTMVVTQRTN